MPETAGEPGAWYSYAVIQLVPRVDRGEAINVGVVLFARTLGFLQVCIVLDEPRLAVLAPDLDLPEVRRHLQAFEAVAGGSPEGGPIAALPPSERFHWLTAPRSTVIQTSPVHIGACHDPSATLSELVARVCG